MRRRLHLPNSIYRSADGKVQTQRWCRDRLDRWDLPHTTTSVSTSQGQTHVLTTGQGPDLLLLPGTNFAAATWLDLIADLASARTVHAVDLPGQPGLSAGVRQRHRGQGYAAWLTEVSERVGAASPTVVGHSLGALVAMHAAASGARVDRLVLLDPAGFMRLTVTVGVLRASLPWLVRPSEPSAATLLRMMQAPGAEPDPGLVEWMALVGRHVRSSLAPEPLDEDAFDRLAQVPMTVVVGRHDVFLPPQRLQRAVSRRLPGRTARLVEGAGHLLPHERPDAVVEAVTSG